MADEQVVTPALPSLVNQCPQANSHNPLRLLLPHLQEQAKTENTRP